LRLPDRFPCLFRKALVYAPHRCPLALASLGRRRYGRAATTAAAAAADLERDEDRLLVCRRPLVCQPERRRRAAADGRPGHEERTALFAGWEVDRLHRQLRRERGRVRDARRGWGAAAAHLASGAG